MSETATKHLWDVAHSYYCNEGNYFGGSGQTVQEYKTWADFIGEEGDSDMDLNLLFRWDWSEDEDEDAEEGKPKALRVDDPYYRNGKLRLFFMTQRKGFHRTAIIEVCRADEPAVREFLEPRLRHLMALWAPLA